MEPFWRGPSAISRKIILHCAIALCAATSAHSQILNGSFENNYTNWIATGHQGIATSDPGHPASDGNKVVVLNPNDGATSAVLSQTFATTTGQRYGLTFDYGTVGPISDQRLQVTLEGNGTLFDQQLVISGPDTGAFYLPQHITFIANSPNTKLTFADASYTYVVLDSLLDNVQVVVEDPQAPVITSDPQSTFAVQGQNATFSVAANGPGTLTYQWKHNGSDIAGANGTSYIVTSADSTKSGNYSVTVTNASGAITSSAATLIILPPAILLNGSFEYGSAAWTFSGSNVSTSTNTGYGVTDGAELCHFNWGQQPATGNLFQTFATTAGATYVVEFDMGAFSVVNQNEQRCHVSVTDSSNSTLGVDDVSVFSPGNGGSYTPQSFTFVASGSSATLRFQDTSPTTTNVDLILDNIRVRVQQSPLITAQPQNATVIAGDPATFTVTAVGNAPLNYQWRFNNGSNWVNVGTNSNSFTINSTQSSDAGMYDVVITNDAGQAMSASAILTVITPGVFANGSFESDYAAWTRTGNQGIVSGSPFSASDGVKAVVFNAGQQPANATLSQSFATQVGHTYLLTFDAGAISFSNQNEQRMQVTLQGQGQASPVQSQSVSVFAPGNGTRYVSQTLTFVADSSSTTLTFQDTSPTTLNVDLMLDNVRITEPPPPGGFSNGSFESGYTNWTATGNQGVASGSPYVATDGTKAIAFNGGQQTPNGVLSQTFATTANQTYSLTFDAGAISFVNQAQQQMQVTVTGSNNSTLLTQTVSVFAPGNGTHYVPQNFAFIANGSTATLKFQDVSATSQNVDLMLDNVAVTQQGGPIITAQPQNTSAQVGGSASFSVTATGQGTVSYQWRFNDGTGWSDIPGTNSSTYTINSMQNSDAGSYEVVVSDTSGQPSVTSSAATLTIVPAGLPTNGSFEFNYSGWTATGNQGIVSGSPFVATNGTKAVVFNAGQQTPNGTLSQTIPTSSGQSYSLTFDVGAISFSNQSAQRLQVSVVDGSNNTLLAPQIVSVSAPGNGTTYITRSFNFTANGANATLMFQDVSQTSQNIDLMLDNVLVSPLTGPVITSQPQSTTAQAGGSATFTVSATGQGTLSYQWRFNNGANWSNIAGANASSLTLNPVQNGDAGSYDVVVSDTSGQPSVTSTGATLTVLPAGVPANGSFEFDYSGWTVTGNQSIVSGSPYTVTDGAKAVDFNGGQQTPNGTLSQTISTNSGQTYSLTFDVGALSFSNQSEQRLQVTVQGSNNTNVLAPQVISVFAPGNGTTYAPQTFTFTADGANATLIFQDVSQTSVNVDLMLDNVRVNVLGAKNSFGNGSFESDYLGWIFTGHQGIVSGAPFVATDGVKAVVFNAGQQTPNGMLSQGFSTTANQTYALTFDAGAISFSNQNEQRLQVTVVSDDNTVLLAPQIVSVFAPGNGTHYVPQTFNFTANGTGATVTFQDVSQTSQNIDLMLDNVQVTAQGGGGTSFQTVATTTSTTLPKSRRPRSKRRTIGQF